MVENSPQLALPISLPELPCFGNFVIGPNQETVEAVRAFACNQGEKQLLLYGVSGSGVSHLAQACAHLVSELGVNGFYLSLSDPGLTAEVIEGLENFEVVCLDGLQAVSSDPEWEEAIFHLFNRLKDDNKRLLIGCDTLPENSQIKLADLNSRLAGMIRYQLKNLSDMEKQTALQQKALASGLKMTDDVARFIMSRGPRDLRQLMAKLAQLDQASLIAKRALTIPFIKQIFKW